MGNTLQRSSEDKRVKPLKEATKTQLAIVNKFSKEM